MAHKPSYDIVPFGAWVTMAQVPAQGKPYLVGGQGHNSVQVFNQLLESRPLRGHRMPAVPHHHVPEAGQRGQMGRTTTEWARGLGEGWSGRPPPPNIELLPTAHRTASF